MQHFQKKIWIILQDGEVVTKPKDKSGPWSKITSSQQQQEKEEQEAQQKQQVGCLSSLAFVCKDLLSDSFEKDVKLHELHMQANVKTGDFSFS